MKKQKQTLLLLIAILLLGTGILQAEVPEKYRKKMKNILDMTNNNIPVRRG